jgi:A/G-specific adenine glycosylase
LDLQPIAPALLAWQRVHGRHALPWQRTRDPYRVWLSEIMLQQTQVVTVLDYYERFLQRFPDVATLAAATLDEVLALWAGLGYYSRARNLHRCAQTVVAEHGGEFPRSAAALLLLPGIGRSTAAAIAAFCFNERAAILDGNVKRVLTRVLAFDGDLAQAAQERALWQHADALLPKAGADMPAYTQGLMDLGATLCLAREPQCLLCPLQQPCRARAAGNATRYPIKTRKLKRSQRENWWLWLSTGEALWLQQRPATGVWASLWSLPLFDSETQLQQAVADLQATLPLQAAESGPGAAQSPAPAVALPSVQHVLTHLDWALHPRRWRLSVTQATCLDPTPSLGESGRWVTYAELDRYGLPAPLRKLLLQTPA